MLEATLNEAVTLKRLLDGMEVLQFWLHQLVTMRTAAVKELVQDANFECNEGGIVSKTCSFFFGGPERCNETSCAESASNG
jgi:hypothetical protein